MLTIILLLVLGIVLVSFGVALLDRTNIDDVILASLIGIGMSAFLIGIVLLFTLVNRQTRFDYTIERYNNLKAITECYDSDSKDKIEAFTLREDILKMNNLISAHKVKSQSPWVNVWYSEKIGNLEPIKVSHVNELSER